MFAEELAHVVGNRNVHCKPCKRPNIDTIRLYLRARRGRAFSARCAYLEVERSDRLLRSPDQCKLVALELLSANALISPPNALRNTALQ